ncbi:hypothetical protein [Streptomyces sp. NPDC058463]|uniref:hypothetical protein n=1 Tax=Streptomyces sp. NPDC058463 TaxID=3346510 RepID=UPI0036542C45
MVIGERDTVVGEPLCSTVVRIGRAAIEGRTLVTGRIDGLVLVVDEVAVEVLDGLEDGVPLAAGGLGGTPSFLAALPSPARLRDSAEDLGLRRRMATTPQWVADAAIVILAIPRRAGTSGPPV